MWFSFFTNVLVSVVGVCIYFLLVKRTESKLFAYFFLFTGIASGIAAFGHHEPLNENLKTNLLLISRAISLQALAMFGAGCLVMIPAFNKNAIKLSFLVLFVVMMSIVLINNVFYPIIIFGVLSLAIIGLVTFIFFVKENRPVSNPIIIGIMLNIGAALIFTLIKELSIFTAADISHILMALSLVFIYSGIRKINYA